MEYNILISRIVLIIFSRWLAVGKAEIFITLYWITLAMYKKTSGQIDINNKSTNAYLLSGEFSQYLLLATFLQSKWHLLDLRCPQRIYRK